jgi:hypothetical protein
MSTETAMSETQRDIPAFFEDHMAALGLYEAFEKKLYKQFPQAGRRIQKTQITFFNRHVFACVSFAQVRRKKDMPDPYITLTLGLPYSLNSSRVSVKCEPYPGRWTTHIVIGSEDELDEQLFSWVKEAWDFSMAKRTRKKQESRN